MNAEGTAQWTAPWWRCGTVYQVCPRTFTDQGLRGVIERVDHLADLGVDAVWLSPVYVSPQRDNGYDISDYQAVDPQLGTLSDLDELIGRLHARGIRLVMDLVVNHTSTEHPWFQESSAGLGSPRRDWYVWRPARSGTDPGTPGAEPTNWESYFSEPAWQHDPATDEYYLHLFAVEQADLNWDNPEVRAAVHAMMRWWLDRGVDGFRMDVVNLLSKRQPFQDGPSFPGRPINERPAGTLGDGSAHYVHGPRLHEFLAEMHEAVLAGREPAPIAIGETPGVTPDQARRLSDPERRELDMVFHFEHVDLDRDPADWKNPVPRRLVDLKEVLARWQEELAGVGWNSLYWGNHDQPRAVSRFGDDSPEHRVASAKTLATVLFLMQGTAFVYQGDELGMANPTLDDVTDLQDISSLNYYRARVTEGLAPAEVMRRLRRTARDNARTPVDWAAALEQGRCEESVLAHHRQLIALRKQRGVVADGSFHLLQADDPQTFCYERRSPAGRVLVVANFSSEPVPAARVPPRPAWAATRLLDTHPAATDPALPPWRSYVWATT